MTPRFGQFYYCEHLALSLLHSWEQQKLRFLRVRSLPKEIIKKGPNKNHPDSASKFNLISHSTSAEWMRRWWQARNAKATESEALDLEPDTRREKGCPAVVTTESESSVHETLFWELCPCFSLGNHYTNCKEFRKLLRVTTRRADTWTYIPQMNSE